jgi:hypothetical protein
MVNDGEEDVLTNIISILAPPPVSHCFAEGGKEECDEEASAPFFENHHHQTIMAAITVAADAAKMSIVVVVVTAAKKVFLSKKWCGGIFMLLLLPQPRPFAKKRARMGWQGVQSAPRRTRKKNKRKKNMAVQISVGKSPAADSVKTKACHSNVLSSFPDRYESIPCQMVCGIDVDDFFTKSCITKLLNYCLNTNYPVNIDTGDPISLSDAETRGDERSLRNYPILYSQICQDGLQKLLKNPDKIGLDGMEPAISDRLTNFCTSTSGTGLRAYGNIVSPKSYSFEKGSSALTIDKPYNGEKTSWRVCSRKLLDERSMNLSEFLENQFLSLNNSTKNVMTGVLSLTGSDLATPLVNDLIPLPKVSEDPGPCYRKTVPFSENGTFSFVASKFVKSSSGLDYLAITDVYSDLFNVSDAAPTSGGAAATCRFFSANGIAKSDAFVLRMASPLRNTVLVNGRTRNVSFSPELRAKIVGVSKGPMLTDSSKGKYVVVTLQLQNIFVNAPYIPLYDNLNCGCFQPMGVDGEQNQYPSEKNVPSSDCGNIGSVGIITGKPACRIGWNSLPPIGSDDISDKFIGTFDAFFFRNLITTANVAPELRALGKDFTGAVSLSTDRNANLIRNICACHLPSSVYENFRQTSTLPATESRVQCDFPGCSESEYPTFDIANKRCQVPQCIQSVVIEGTGIVAQGNVTIGVALSCNGTSVNSVNNEPSEKKDSNIGGESVLPDYGRDSVPDPERDNSMRTLIIAGSTVGGLSLVAVAVVAAVVLFGQKRQRRSSTRRYR